LLTFYCVDLLTLFDFHFLQFCRFCSSVDIFLLQHSTPAALFQKQKLLPFPAALSHQLLASISSPPSSSPPSFTEREDNQSAINHPPCFNPDSACSSLPWLLATARHLLHHPPCLFKEAATCNATSSQLQIRNHHCQKAQSSPCFCPPCRRRIFSSAVTMAGITKCTQKPMASTPPFPASTNPCSIQLKHPQQKREERKLLHTPATALPHLQNCYVHPIHHEHRARALIFPPPEYPWPHLCKFQKSRAPKKSPCSIPASKPRPCPLPSLQVEPSHGRTCSAPRPHSCKLLLLSPPPPLAAPSLSLTAPCHRRHHL
jgi:hypothetical protein